MLSSSQLQEKLAKDSARFGLSPESTRTLLELAVDAKERAYCPYSRFRVGAAIRSAESPQGQYFTGVNVENASYPVGTCAERCAIGKAVSEGYTQFNAIAVSTDAATPTSPCGMCRQFLREFCFKEIPIFMCYGNSADSKTGKPLLVDYIVTTLEELLPMSFGPGDLRKFPLTAKDPVIEDKWETKEI